MKRREASEEDLVDIELLSAAGKTVAQIAKILGMSRATFGAMRDRDPRIDLAFQRGRATPLKQGRKPDPAPENATEVILGLAERMGVKKTEMAQALGVSVYKLNRLLEDDPAIKAAMRAAKIVEEDILMGSLFQAALKGNIASAMFLLKTRHAYNDRGDGKAGEAPVQVHISLPGAQSPEQYAKTIEHTPAGKEAQKLIEQDKTAPINLVVVDREEETLDPVLN